VPFLRWKKAAFHGAIIPEELGQGQPSPCKAQGMKLPDFAVPVLRRFQPAFSTPTYHRFLVLWLGAL